MIRVAKRFADEVSRLANAGSTTESTYYPAIKALLSDLLAAQNLPFEVRTGTAERRPGKGADLPDLAFYDGSGTVVVLFGEVKLPSEDLASMAASTDRNDQVGRYLAQTRAVLLCNVRAFGLVTTDPAWPGTGAVPPTHRRLEQEVELWPSIPALKRGQPIPPAAVDELAALVETAVTRYASIGEPESLARILARQARRAKEDLPEKFSQAVSGLLQDFGKALGITFEGPEGEAFFRSSLIQTAFYGLFAGWTLWWHGKRRKPFRWEDLSDYLTIPFLGELFHEFRHPARLKELRLAKHLDIGTETLSRVIPDRFFARFRLPSLKSAEPGTKPVASTAITYFYEPFLEAFDPELRKALGVWYTPTEIIRYQVARIDQLLRTQLGCGRGFADDKVVVLDPCCGTGAYLIEVARHVAGQLEADGAGALLGAKLLDVLCHRIIGFEILTAPFVIAQLQLYLILSELGATPRESQRPAIFLTNALTGWEGPDQLKLNFPELQQEHDAVQGVKKDAKIIVILGNPPYNRFAGVPVAEEADLVDHYKGIKRDRHGKQLGKSELFTRWGVRKHLLDDFYVRFFRLAETRIGERAEYGVVSFISNYSFYTGRSHPLMRESLLKHFHKVWIDSLNGDKYKTGKVIPEGLPGAGTTDQSIFTTDQDPRGIQVGTGITTLVKLKAPKTSPPVATVHYREFWGRSDRKRLALLESLGLAAWTKPKRTAASGRPEGPRDYEAFMPTAKNSWKFVPRSTRGGFEDWPSLDELFPTAYQGVNPNRGVEGSVIDTDKAALAARMKEYYSKEPWADFLKRHPVICEPRARYDPQATRETLGKVSGFRPDHVVPYVLFPLDARWLYYETEAKLLNERRPDLWENRHNNEFLIAVPEPRRLSEARPLFATTLFDLHLHDRGSVGFPAEVRPAHDLFAASTGAAPLANLADSAWQGFSKAWNLRGDRTSATAKRLTRQLFRVCLALCHSSQYETDHQDSLAQDWAHVPIPTTKALFDEVAELGDRVAVLLNPLVDAGKVISTTLGKDVKGLSTVERVGGKAIVESDLVVTYSYYGAAQGSWRPRDPAATEPWYPAWGSKTGDLYLNETVFLRHIPELVWRFELGGYPVLKKWLGYRDANRRGGAALTLAEVDHLRGMVHRLAVLLLLHEQLDVVYERAGAKAFSAEDLGLR